MTITSMKPAWEAIETTLRIMVSAISLWEIAIKVGRDRRGLPIAGPVFGSSAAHHETLGFVRRIPGRSSWR